MQIKNDKHDCPKIKSIEEKRLLLYYRPLTIFEASIIFFPSKTTAIGMKVPSSTQLHSESYQITPSNKQTSRVLV